MRPAAAIACRTAAAAAACTLALAGWAAEPDATLLPEVGVSATFDALTEQRLAPGVKLVIDAEEIRSLGGLSVAEVLRKLPGLERAGHGADSAAAGARGVARDAVLILVNGERPTASGRHALTLVGRLPAGELERIELLRGSSAEFGATAEIVVNLVMKAPVSQRSASLRVVGGQRGDEPNAQLTASLGGGQGGFSWLLPVTVNRHRMPVGSRQWRMLPAAWSAEALSGHYSVDELILSPRLSWKAGDTRLSLWPSHYRNDGLRRQTAERGGAGEPLAAARHDRERSAFRIARLRADGETRVGVDGKLSTRLALMDGERDTRTRRTGPLSPAWSEALDRHEREFTGSLRLDQALAETHLLSLALEGAAFSRHDRQALDAANHRHVVRERNAALWLQDEWTLSEALTLTAGLRLEAARQHAGSGWHGERAASPSLALRWQAAEAWVLRASAGTGLRVPKLDEITPLVMRSTEYNTPLEADVGGNPDLSAERVLRVEFGVERYLAGEKSVLGMNLYARRTRDFIERRSALEAGRWVERPYNAGDARHWGVELSARLDAALLARALDGGSLRATLTLPHARVDDARLGIRRIANDTPRHLFSLSYEHAPAGAATRFGFQLKHSGPARTRLGDERIARIRSGTRLDAHVTRQIARGVDLRLSVDNLLGAAERQHRHARHGAESWRLDGRDGGERTWLLALEGKW